MLNVVTTTDAAGLSKTLQADDRLRKVSFTGSTGVGRMLVEQSADQLQRVSMELGGNAPFLVFADADLDAAVDGAMVAKMRNMGEACTAANRFLVHADVAEEFGAEAGRADGRAQRRPRPGRRRRRRPADRREGGRVGEPAGHRRRARRRAGAGGRPAPDGPGYFYPPTVLVDVPPDSAINTEEIFGPVAPITTFTTDDEAVAAANDTEYGLSSYVYTRDLARAIRVAEALEFGMVGVNTGLVSNAAAPFGGVKASGFGREGGFEGIEEYLETTYLNLAVQRLSPSHS